MTMVTPMTCPHTNVTPERLQNVRTDSEQILLRLDKNIRQNDAAVNRSTDMVDDLRDDSSMCLSF